MAQMEMEVRGVDSGGNGGEGGWGRAQQCPRVTKFNASPTLLPPFKFGMIIEYDVNMCIRRECQARARNVSKLVGCLRRLKDAISNLVIGGGIILVYEYVSSALTRNTCAHLQILRSCPLRSLPPTPALPRASAVLPEPTSALWLQTWLRKSCFEVQTRLPRQMLCRRRTARCRLR